MKTLLPIVLLVLVAASWTYGLGTVRHGRITVIGRYRWQFVRSFDNEENEPVTEKLNYKASTAVSYSGFRQTVAQELENRREKFLEFTTDPPYVTSGGDDWFKGIYSNIVRNRTEFSTESSHSDDYQVGANDSPTLYQLCFDGPGVTLVTGTISREEDRYNVEDVAIFLGYTRAATPEEQAHADISISN